MAVQLTQTEQRERHRLAKVLHDGLQQLLVGAKFNLSILRNEAAGDNRLTTIQRVDELLDQSLATSRSLTVEMSPPILYQGTLSQVLDWLGSWMHEKHGLTVHLKIDKQANPKREEIRVLVFEAVRELLLNAVKHAKVTSACIGVTRVDKGHVQVVVADEGAGFDPAPVQPKDESGFGLLSMRQRLAAIGGRVEIDSAPGKGTRITLVVPTDLAKVSDVTVSPAAIPQASPSTGATGRPAPAAPGDGQAIRVLLADDHAVVRDGLGKLLQLQLGIDVIGRASDGQQALDMALQLQPDVVVMDVTMPKLSGMEATRQILAKLPATHVIGLSMHIEPDIAAAMREAGAAAYLSKSAQPEALIATIRACVAKA
jgi:CheY-like chemotaxis protein